MRDRVEINKTFAPQKTCLEKELDRDVCGLSVAKQSRRNRSRFLESEGYPGVVGGYH